MFPTQVLLPKSETQADIFLNKNPSFDGRGVVVAIFDTGVDPGAYGLQETTDNKPKIVDIVDSTGSGDVTIEQVVETDENGILQSPLSKRKFRIGHKDNGWTNSNGNRYNIGIKRAYELFPEPLVNRIKEERKKEFERRHLESISAIKKRIEDGKKVNKKESGNNTTHESSSPLNHHHDQADLELQIEQLNDMYKNYDDPGPIYDCICFHDGNVWRACIYPDDNAKREDNTRSSGGSRDDDVDDIIELNSYALLTDYATEHKYSTFTAADKMNYSVNFYNDGKILSIVTTAGSHGTHVAGIVAANCTDNPDLNGVAPGCQIVSVKIGNSYLGSMETNTGMCRGIIAAKKNNCHLVNMSYGEASFMPDQGRFAQLVSELVNKYNVVFVSSAGNSGPALSTFGSPGENSDVIGVGAFVSGDMMKVIYSLREKLPDNQYTWSSRGPSLDGWPVSISGPGAAITCVPEYELQKSQRMNGTSMSSPNVCGGIACIVSAMIQSGHSWNPHYVKRAIENTARLVPNVEPFALGHGILQISDAFEWIKKHPYNTHENLKYTIKIVRRKARGVYLRDHHEVSQPSEHTVQVETKFAEDTPNSDKINYQKRIQLQSTQSWIQSPAYFVSVNEASQFVIKVDPTMLAENQAYYGEVLGLDADNLSAGPLFRVPVTVIKPVKLHDHKSIYSLGKMSFRPGTIARHFITVPKGSEFAEITLNAHEMDEKRIFLLQCLQLRPKTAFTVHEFKKYIYPTQDDKQVHYIKAIPGATLEICVAQFWSSLGVSNVSCSVEFHGVNPTPSSLHMGVGALNAKLTLDSTLKNEDLKIKASLDTWTQHLRPKSSDIVCLSDDRDRLLNRDVMYSMILTYSFKLDESCQVCFGVPTISSMLYESILESQLIMIFNGNKKLLKVCDAWPKKTKLPKGEITVRLFLRHEKLSLLESLKHTILDIDRTLAKEIAITVYDNVNSVLQRSGTKVENFTLPFGSATAVYVCAPEDKDLPKEAKLGDVLSGKVKLFEKSTHGRIPLTYNVPTRIKKEEDKTTEKKELEKLDTRNAQEKLNEHMVEEAVKYMEKLFEKSEEFEPLISSLRRQYGDNLAILKLELQYLSHSSNKQRSKNLPQVISIADKMVSLIDTTQMAIHFGTIPKNKESTKDDYEWIKLNKDMEKQKGFLIEALCKKAQMLAEFGNTTDNQNFDKTVKELEKWVDVTSDFKYLELYVSLLLKKGKYGKVLEVTRKALTEGKASDSSAEKKVFDKLRSTIDKLGWKHWQEYYDRVERVEYPASYPIQ